MSLYRLKSLGIGFIGLLIFLFPAFSSASVQRDAPKPLLILQQAEETALTIKDRTIQFQALSQVAKVYAKAGSKESSEKLFHRLSGLIDSIEKSGAPAPDSSFWSFGKVSLLVDLASVQMEFGSPTDANKTLEHALGIAESIKPAEKQIEAICRIAMAQIRAGNQSGVINLIEKMLNPDAPLISETADAESEKLGCAIRLAKKLESRKIKTSVNEIIQNALQRVNSSQDEWAKSGYYLAIATAQARLGDETSAKETLNKVFSARDRVHSQSPDKTEHFKINALLSVTMGLIEAEDRPAATRMLETALQRTYSMKEGSLQLEKYKSGAFRDIAITAAKLGDIKMALEAEAAILNERFKGVSIPYIIQAQIKSGDLKQALQLVNSIREDDPGEGGALLRQIAIAQVEAGDFRGALKTAEADPNSEDSRFLRSIASARVKMGDTGSAYEWASSQRTPIQKVYALIGIAEGLLN